MLVLVVALRWEARPLIDHLRLRPVATNPFACYRRDEIGLIISGPGRLAAAAAVGYWQGRWAGDAPWGWVNVGVAGHSHRDVATAWVAHTIVDLPLGRRFYPPLATPLAAPADCLYSVDRPEQLYPEAGLYDMEAAGFYAFASRFATAEVVQTLKVVSDNPSAPIADLTPHRLSELIAGQLTAIEALLRSVMAMVAELRRLAADPPGYQALLAQFPFTESERHQLRQLLQRYRLYYAAPPEPPPELAGRRGGELLAWLRQRLQGPLPLALPSSR